MARKNPRSITSYRHPDATSPMRPEVGTQPQFKKKKPRQNYRYDSSLAPQLEWDTNPAREHGETLIHDILQADTLEAAKTAAEKLRAMSRPFLNWAGKAERLSFDVPTLPLFIHERLSTEGILESVRGRRVQEGLFDIYGDPKRSVADQVLHAFEYQDKWVNRMILGDSLVVMNSLLNYENLGGQVQMIYIDPPYGVKFGSNFQPFVRRRDVTHNDDEDFTREPEMVQAYRDTWELGLHSYLTYLRDRLLLARDLLTYSGSVFVQISDENLHHVRELMDEVFGAENSVSLITVRKTTSEGSSLLGSTCDFLLWYARDKTRVKYRPFYVQRSDDAEDRYDQVLLPDGTVRPITHDERDGNTPVPEGARIFQLGDMTSSRPAGEGDVKEFFWNGNRYTPGTGTFKTNLIGLEKLAVVGRLQATGKGKLRYRRFKDDFGYVPIANLWNDISGAVQSRADPKVYVVQTSTAAIQRAMLMTTDPGDLVLDPTCGSGTTAFVAEHWGRRWITIDTSRVPLSLARQRILSASFPMYALKDEARGPAGGFEYKEGKGIVKRITLGSIANDEPPEEVVLVDRPEEVRGAVRVAGPFTFEATIPTPMDWDITPDDAKVSDEATTFTDRMLEILRRSPVLHLGAGRSVTLKNVRRPAKTLSLSAEGIVINGEDKPVAFVFGPENGAVSEKLVFEAGKEANAKGYTHLYVIGFAVQPNARLLIEQSEETFGVHGTYVQATPDLLMGDLLKNMRSSQIFSVCGLPEITVQHSDNAYTVELLGLDVFDPISMEVTHQKGADVPAWFLDTDYNGLVFRVDQAFFPRTGAWDNLKRELRLDYAEDVWDHLAGTTSTPFQAGEHKQIAVKVVDARGNELLVVKKLEGTT